MYQYYQQPNNMTDKNKILKDIASQVKLHLKKKNKKKFINSLSSFDFDFTDCNEQLTKNDFHSWNITPKGEIRDGLDKEYMDTTALYHFNHKDYTITYKKWDEYSSYYKDLIKKGLKNCEKLDKNLKLQILKINLPNTCIQQSVVKNNIFNWEIQLGSLGLIDNKTGKIVWEYGNGKEKSDF